MTAVQGAKFNMLFSGAAPVNGAKAPSMVGQSFEGATKGSNNNLFKGETAGLNSMQIGDTVNTPAQAGKAAGVSRLLYNA